MKYLNGRLEIVKIVGTYALIGSLWVYYSDSAISFLVRDQNLTVRIGMMKGLLFVAFTSLLLYLLVKQRISKYRHIEKSLRKSREQYRALIESISGISWEFDLAQDNWTYISPQSLHILGYSPDEWRGTEWWREKLHCEDRKWITSFCKMSNATETHYSCEYRMNAKDGRVVWISDNVSVERLNNVPIILRGIMLDITERKSTEAELRKSRNMLSHVLNSVPQSILWKDLNSVYQGCNRVFAQGAGVSGPEKIVGKTDFDLPWSRAESEGYRADDREVMRGNTPKYHIIETQQRPDGTTIWLNTTKIPLTDTFGTVEGVLVVYEDVTLRKRMEAREQSRLSILEKIATGASLTDLLVHIVKLVEQEVSGALCSILLANEAGTKLRHGAAPSLPDFYNNAVDGLKIGPGMGSCGTAAYLRKRVIVEKIEGHSFWNGFSAVSEAGLQSCWSEPIISSEGTLLGTLATYYLVPHSPDNDEIAFVESVVYLASIAIENKHAEEKHRSLQEQMRQMQKIEAIGQLTGGIAHDFNNMLTPIFVYAEMIKTSLSEDDSNFRKIEGLISSAHKAKDLTQKLLAFSRKQILSMEYLDLNEVVVSLHALLRSIIRENITIDLLLSEESAQVFADKGQLEQILVNLTVNAQDAIEGNGAIAIQTGHVVLDDDTVKRNPGMKSGPHILLAFSDNGRGMNDDIINHVFEPFFTTKDVGKGTGLGLATVYGLVKQHDGYIKIQSREGEGTTFLMYLPESRGDTKITLTEQPVFPRKLPCVADKTILVVDDNQMVLKIAEILLESVGYKVLTAESPQLALTIVETCNASIDLLITDVVMPEMNGPELYGRLTELSPDLPVIFISGYTPDVTNTDDSYIKNANFLPKPFTSEQLLYKIEQALTPTIQS